MPAASDRLFTPRFFLMCGFTFTVFLSAFQLLPVAPFRILELGGNEFAAGLFLGLLTYASAFSAPFTGALGDRVGKRPMLLACSLAIAGFSAAYGLAQSYRLLLLLVFFHGIFWSGLLSASSAYMTDMLPESRRAEGISYWGMSTMLAVAVAPSVGFWAYRSGWGFLMAETALLNLGMAAIAWKLEEARVSTRWTRYKFFSGSLVEWRVVMVSLSLFLCSFGYGGITSFAALYAERSGIAPKGIYFTSFAAVVLATRPFSGRLADRVGHRRFFLPCLAVTIVGFALLALPQSRGLMIASAVVFGLGFGNMYPAYVAYVVRHVEAERRGAAFGGILAAFDTGIGTGSICLGGVIHRFGFSAAFGVAAVLSALSIPYFLFSEKRFLLRPAATVEPVARAAAG
jgi:MFS family permease